MAVSEEGGAGAVRRIVVGISGASGAVYGIRLLQALREASGIETHAVVSAAGWRNLRHEMNIAPALVDAIADKVHDIDDVGATIASGSFRVSAMVIAPCSMRTLAAVAHGIGDNLISRAADVMLKERRRLVLVARETPLHLVHLRNMVAVTEMGGIICPPVPAFYAKPRTVEDIVDQTVSRVLDLLDIDHSLTIRWAGEEAA